MGVVKSVEFFSGVAGYFSNQNKGQTLQTKTKQAQEPEEPKNALGPSRPSGQTGQTINGHIKS